MASITIELPEDLAARARAAGLLSPARAQQVFERALDHDDGFLDLLERVRANSGEPMPMEEIVAEVKAVRKEMAEERRAAGH